VRTYTGEVQVRTQQLASKAQEGCAKSVGVQIKEKLKSDRGAGFKEESRPLNQEKATVAIRSGSCRGGSSDQHLIKSRSSDLSKGRSTMGSHCGIKGSS
jgi:hypothetical protein